MKPHHKCSRAVSVLLSFLFFLPSQVSAQSVVSDPGEVLPYQQEILDRYAELIEQSASLGPDITDLPDEGNIGRNLKIEIDWEALAECRDEHPDSPDVCEPTAHYVWLNDFEVYNPAATESEQPVSYGGRLALGYMRLAHKVMVETALETKADMVENAVDRLGIDFFDERVSAQKENAEKEGKIYFNDYILPRANWEGLSKHYPSSAHPDLWRSVEKLYALAQVKPQVDPRERREVLDMCLDLAEIQRAIYFMTPKKDLREIFGRNALLSKRFINRFKERGSLYNGYSVEQMLAKHMSKLMQQWMSTLYPEYRILQMPYPYEEIPENIRPRKDIYDTIAMWDMRSGAPPLYVAIAALVYEHYGVNPKDLHDPNKVSSLDFPLDDIPLKLYARMRLILTAGYKAYMVEHGFFLQKLLDLPLGAEEFAKEFMAYAPIFLKMTNLKKEMARRYVIPGAGGKQLDEILNTAWEKWREEKWNEEKRKDTAHGLMIAATSVLFSGWVLGRLALRPGVISWVGKGAGRILSAERAAMIMRLLRNEEAIRRGTKWLSLTMTLAFTVEAVWSYFTIYPDYSAASDLRRAFDMIYYAATSGGKEDFSAPITLETIQKFHILESDEYRRLLWSYFIIGMTSLPGITWAGKEGYLLLRRWWGRYALVPAEVMTRLTNELDMVIDTIARMQEGMEVDLAGRAAPRAAALRRGLGEISPYSTKIYKAVDFEPLGNDVAKATRVRYLIDKLQVLRRNYARLRKANTAWIKRVRSMDHMSFVETLLARPKEEIVAIARSHGISASEAENWYEHMRLLKSRIDALHAEIPIRKYVSISKMGEVKRKIQQLKEELRIVVSKHRVTITEGMFDQIGQVNKELQKLSSFYYELQSELRSLPISPEDTFFVSYMKDKIERTGRKVKNTGVRAKRFTERIFRRVFRGGAATSASVANSMGEARGVAKMGEYVPLGAVEKSPELSRALEESMDSVQKGLWQKLRSVFGMNSEKMSKLAKSVSFTADKEGPVTAGINRFLGRRGFSIKVEPSMFRRYFQKNLVNVGVNWWYDRYHLGYSDDEWEKKGKLILYVNISVGFMMSLFGQFAAMSNMTVFEGTMGRLLFTIPAQLGVMTMTNMWVMRDQENPVKEFFSPDCVQKMAARSGVNFAWIFQSAFVSRALNATMSAAEGMAKTPVGHVGAGLTKYAILTVDRTVLGPWLWRYFTHKIDAEGVCDEPDNVLLAMSRYDRSELEKGRINRTAFKDDNKDGIPDDIDRRALLTAIAYQVAAKHNSDFLRVDLLDDAKLASALDDLEKKALEREKEIAKRIKRARKERKRITLRKKKWLKKYGKRRRRGFVEIE